MLNFFLMIIFEKFTLPKCHIFQSSCFLDVLFFKIHLFPNGWDASTNQRMAIIFFYFFFFADCISMGT